MNFKISDQIYDRLKNYLTEYIMRGYGNSYNNYNDPRAGNGAGCSAFAMSFLDVAGFLDDSLETEWSEYINVPYKLVGGPVSGKKVSLLQIILSNQWAKSDEPYIRTKFYVPNYIYNWILQQWDTEYEKRTGNITILKRNQAYGIELDYRDKPCPTEEVFRFSMN